MRVIANAICLHGCPFLISHGAGQAHASQEGHASCGAYLDCNAFMCMLLKFRAPYRLIASDWIRPEDAHYYEELCDRVGYKRFSLKLLERTRDTAFLCRVVEAYVDERYDGNLIDILAMLSRAA